MNTNGKPVIGVTLGDAAGVGAEIFAKTAATGVLERTAHAVVIADEREVRRGAEVAEVEFPYIVVDSVEEAVEQTEIAVVDTKRLDAYAVELGAESVDCGRNAGLNLQTAIERCAAGTFDGVVFGPNNKKMLKEAGFELNGAIDLVARFLGYEGYRTEISVLGNIWTSRVTSHLPLKDVSATISTEKILQAITLLHDTQKLAGFENPHIAVAALNPHAGEGGMYGTEEIDIVAPAVARAQEREIHAEGPLPADTLFYHLFRGTYDSAVTLYHDQGQIALKLRGFGQGVTVFGGVPKPVASCAHGTAFDVAGKGIADPGAFTNAYEVVSAMATGSLAARSAAAGR